MGIRSIEGTYDGGERKAVMVCSTSGQAFGPLFEDAEEIDDFLAWCAKVGAGEPRRMLAEILDERDMRARTIGVAPVGCAVIAFAFFIGSPFRRASR